MGSPAHPEADHGPGHEDEKSDGRPRADVASKVDQKPKPDSKTEPKAHDAPKTLGNVTITTEPRLAMTRGGKGSSVKLTDIGGDFVIGTGTSVDGDPFALTVRYAVHDEAVSFTLDPEPWAIVTCTDATSGKSPQTTLSVAEAVTCDLANPKDGRKLHVTLRRTR